MTVNNDKSHQKSHLIIHLQIRLAKFVEEKFVKLKGVVKQECQQVFLSFFAFRDIYRSLTKFSFKTEIHLEECHPYF